MINGAGVFFGKAGSKQMVEIVLCLGSLSRALYSMAVLEFIT